MTVAKFYYILYIHVYMYVKPGIREQFLGGGGGGYSSKSLVGLLGMR